MSVKWYFIIFLFVLGAQGLFLFLLSGITPGKLRVPYGFQGIKISQLCEKQMPLKSVLYQSCPGSPNFVFFQRLICTYWKFLHFSGDMSIQNLSNFSLCCLFILDYVFLYLIYQLLISYLEILYLIVGVFCHFLGVIFYSKKKKKKFDFGSGEIGLKVKHLFSSGQILSVPSIIYSPLSMSRTNH